MSAFDILPGELMSALDAFMLDQKSETRGRAIRMLVTDMLTQLGYLRHMSDKDVRPEKPVHFSSNGDVWFLATDADGNSVVIHRANPSSGGTETTVPTKDFLGRNDGSPEGIAVRAALDVDLGDDRDLVIGTEAKAAD